MRRRIGEQVAVVGVSASQCADYVRTQSLCAGA